MKWDPVAINLRCPGKIRFTVFLNVECMIKSFNGLAMVTVFKKEPVSLKTLNKTDYLERYKSDNN